MKEVTKYIANDGEEFLNYEECLEHEQKKMLEKMLEGSWTEFNFERRDYIYINDAINFIFKNKDKILNFFNNESKKKNKDKKGGLSFIKGDQQ
jgi:hypothetical protein